MASHSWGYAVIDIVPYMAYVLIAGGFSLLLWVACRSDASARQIFIYPLICSFFVATGATVSAHYSIVTSTSSTAAIGYIFLPIISLIAAVVGFVLSWSLLYLVRSILEAAGKVSGKITSGPGVAAALLVLCVAGVGIQCKISRDRLLSRASSASVEADAIREMVDHAISSRDVEALSTLAKNPTVPVADLIRIYDSCKSRIDDINAMEYDVFLSLARNRQTPAEILTRLATCKQDSIRTEVGMNPSTPTETLWQLAKDASSMVRCWLAFNPVAPKDLLLQLAKDPDHLVRDYAAAYLKYRGFSPNN